MSKKVVVVNAGPQHLSIISYLEECAKYFEQ